MSLAVEQKAGQKPGLGKGAVVLLSGGLDSATCLALARAQGYACHTLSVDYGQRHHAELDASSRLAAVMDVASHRVIKVDLGVVGGSALTDPALVVPDAPSEGIPITYVPARNTTLLSLALGLAEALDLRDIFIGANAVDYSGYPDCRPAFIEAFETLANLATRAGVEGQHFHVHAPLIALTKAGIIRLGVAHAIDYGLTVSCYQADPDGRACGRCDSCRIRRAGFLAAGIPDPTRYQSGSLPAAT